MLSRHIEEIRALPLFAQVSEASFADLTRGAYVQNFPSHAELITEGDPADFLHVVISGCIEMFASWQGRETSLFLLGPHDTFILAATIKDRPYLMSARTLEKSRLIMIPSEDIRAVFEHDSDFAKAIVSELAACYRGAIKGAKNLRLRTSSERLANFLIGEYHAHGARERFALDFEKKRIAKFLGMTRENLSRAFANLRSHGVQVDGQEIVITDLDKLIAFARPDPLID